MASIEDTGRDIPVHDPAKMDAKARDGMMRRIITAFTCRRSVRCCEPAPADGDDVWRMLGLRDSPPPRVLTLLKQGFTYRQIGDLQGMTPSQVERAAMNVGFQRPDVRPKQPEGDS